MTNTSIYQSTLPRRSVSESDSDPLNSTVNPQGNPNQYIPPDRAESNPNISVSGFIDESPYTGPGTSLQLQWEGMETRITEIMEHFKRLKSEINEWENSLKILAVPAVELNRQFASFSKVICELSNQALLARVLIPICGAIWSLKKVITRINKTE